MKKTEIKEIPARQEEINKYYCDLCNEKISNPRYSCGQGEVNYYKEYHNWGGDGGYSKEYIFDLCNECIKTKVFPLIKKELNIKPRLEEHDW